VRSFSPLCASHTNAVSSPDAVARRLPSGLHDTLKTEFECPVCSTNSARDAACVAEGISKNNTAATTSHNTVALVRIALSPLRIEKPLVHLLLCV
jgi:hypothetical protein